MLAHKIDNLEQRLRINPDQTFRSLIEASRSTAHTFEELPLTSAVKIVSKNKPNGPSVSIFGGIHGDEIAGVIAVHQLLSELVSDQIILNKGSLVLLIGNEEALKTNQRYNNKNLNRLFTDEIVSTGIVGYEESRANLIRPIITRSDYLLDIHSTFRPTIPYILAEKEVLDQAIKFGATNIVTGWSELAKGSVAGDTESFCVRNGGCAFTLESGQHTAAESVSEAYQSARKFLNFAESCDLHSNLISQVSLAGDAKVFVHKLCEVYEMPASGNFRYAEGIQAYNFEPIAANSIIGYADEQPIIAKFNATLVLPKDPSRVKPGEELYILAKTNLAKS